MFFFLLVFTYNIYNKYWQSPVWSNGSHIAQGSSSSGTWKNSPLVHMLLWWARVTMATSATRIWRPRTRRALGRPLRVPAPFYSSSASNRQSKTKNRKSQLSMSPEFTFRIPLCLWHKRNRLLTFIYFFHILKKIWFLLLVCPPQHNKPSHAG